MSKATRRKKKKSVLLSQKPKRNRKKNRPIPLSYIFALLAVPLLAWGAFALYNTVDSMLLRANEASTAPLNWAFDIKLEGEESLDSSLAEDIMELAATAAGSGTKSELEDAVTLIQQEAAFAHVSIIRTGSETATIFLSRRVPIMCINADKLRLLTAEGSVYGSPEIEKCPGPVLTGIFHNRSHSVTVREDMTIKLTRGELAAVTDAGRLLKVLEESNIVAKTLSYQRFRGFTATLKTSETTISLGQYPFDGRVGRLTEILAKLKRKRQVAARIELDYQGKAFIKLKKL